MPYRNRTILPQNFYHIYNRGNNRQPIFLESENYAFFLRRFQRYFPPDQVEIHAYCLIPNHYHLAVRIVSDIDYTKQMQSFSISYAKSINERYKRVGHLFQGRFRAKHIDSTSYLLHLSRYIHLNPQHAGLVNKASRWEYSSYPEYLQGIRSCEVSVFSSADGRPRVTVDFVLSHFAGAADYRDYVESYGEDQMKRMNDLLWK